MDAIAFVPARRGSRRIEFKNRRELINGLTLTAWTVNQAVHSGLFRKIVVSTDDPQTWESVISGLHPRIVGEKHPQDFAIVRADDTSHLHQIRVERHRRPVELCRDDSSTLLAINHYLSTQADSQLHIHYDALALLQPTSPFRTKETIQACLDLIETGESNYVLTAHKPKFVINDTGLLIDHSDLMIPNGNVYAWRIYRRVLVPPGTSKDSLLGAEYALAEYNQLPAVIETYCKLEEIDIDVPQELIMARYIARGLYADEDFYDILNDETTLLSGELK